MPTHPDPRRRAEQPSEDDVLAAVVIGILDPLTRAATRGRGAEAGAVRGGRPGLSGLVGDLAGRVVGDTLETLLVPAPRRRGSGWDDVVDRPAPASRPAPAATGTEPTPVTIDLSDRAALARIASRLDVDVVDLAEALRSTTTPVVETEPGDPAARLVDRDGDTWARVGDTWVSQAHSPRSFDTLLLDRGPLHTARP